MPAIRPLHHLSASRFEIPVVLKGLASASRNLAELKGIASSIPNRGILVNTLGMQEAKDSSAIENIVTTHDELFKDDALPENFANPAAEEVLRYRQALRLGFGLVQETRLLTLNHILRVQAELERNNGGFRKLPGTALKDATGRTVYAPPQNPAVTDALGESSTCCTWSSRDYWIFQSCTSAAILFAPKATTTVCCKPLEEDAWEDWVSYLLSAVEQTAGETIRTVAAIKAALLDYKHRIRARHKFYSQDLINNLFTHPYTMIAFIENDLKVSRLTATRYLDALSDDGFLAKRKIGRSNYYINVALDQILTGTEVERVEQS